MTGKNQTRIESLEIRMQAGGLQRQRGVNIPVSTCQFLVVIMTFDSGHAVVLLGYVTMNPKTRKSSYLLIQSVDLAVV